METLVNASELKDELVKRGSIFQTSTDTEVILHLYARSRRRRATRRLSKRYRACRARSRSLLMTRIG
jgi:amidophosphoribosyltransferase